MNDITESTIFFLEFFYATFKALKAKNDIAFSVPNTFPEHLQSSLKGITRSNERK